MVPFLPLALLVYDEGGKSVVTGCWGSLLGASIGWIFSACEHGYSCDWTTHERVIVGYIHKGRSHRNYNQCFVFHAFVQKLH